MIDPIYGPGVASLLVIDPATEPTVGCPRQGRTVGSSPTPTSTHSLSFVSSLPLTTTLTFSLLPFFTPSKIHILELVAVHGRFAFFCRCSVSSSVRPFVSPAWRVFCKERLLPCVLFVTNQSDPAEPNLIHKPTGSTSFLKLQHSLVWHLVQQHTCAPLHLKLAYPITFLYDILCSHLRHRRRFPNNPTPAPIVPANSFFVPALDCIAFHSSRLSNQPRDLVTTQDDISYRRSEHRVN